MTKRQRQVISELREKIEQLSKQQLFHSERCTCGTELGVFCDCGLDETENLIWDLRNLAKELTQ